jgi:hypothetical protein
MICGVGAPAPNATFPPHDKREKIAKNFVSRLMNNKDKVDTMEKI